jgi:hypothetical protein
MIKVALSGAIPQINDPAVKRATPTMNKRRRPEDVAERPTGQQERRIGEIVAVEDPLQLGDARSKLRADVLQREIDDRRVELCEKDTETRGD